MAPLRADRRFAKVGLALLLASAVGLFLDFGPRSRDSASLAVVGEAEIRGLLREPRSLPEIDVTDGDGRPARLASFRGKVILLNLWATWCAPCRKEMPALDRLQARLGGAEFEVVALSVDRDGLPVVRAFYGQTGTRHLRIYVDEAGQAMTQLGVAAIPTTLIVDRRGREIGRWVGPAEWDERALRDLIVRTRS